MPADQAPDGKVVMTKIDDQQGCRNVATLKRGGRLWWTPDGSMYVYYTPTHFRHLTAAEREAERRSLNLKAERLEKEAKHLKDVQL